MVRTKTKKRKEASQNAAEALLAMMVNPKKTVKTTRKKPVSKLTKKAGPKKPAARQGKKTVPKKTAAKLGKTTTPKKTVGKEAMKKAAKKLSKKTVAKRPTKATAPKVAKKAPTKAISPKKRRKVKVVESKRKNIPFRLRVHNILKSATWTSPTQAIISYEDLVNQNQDLICAKQSMLKRLKRHGFSFCDVGDEDVGAGPKDMMSVISHPLLTKDTWMQRLGQIKVNSQLYATYRRKKNTVDSLFHLRLERILKQATWMSKQQISIPRKIMVKLNSDLDAPVSSMKKRMKDRDFTFDESTKFTLGDLVVFTHKTLTEDNWQQELFKFQ
jgi:hypothetical protein